MNKNKKQHYLLVGLIIILVITIALIGEVLSENYDTDKYINTFDFSTWKVGEYAGINGEGTTVGSNTYAEGFQVLTNKKFYCMEHNQSWSSGKYQLVAKVVINGGKILEHSNIGEELKVIEDDEAKKTNLVLTEIIKEAIANENSDNRARSRSEMFRGDFYQNIMWQYMSVWNNANFENPLKYIVQSTTNMDYKQQAEDKIKELTAKAEENNLVDSTFITAVDKKEGFDSSNLVVVGDNTIIGPFKYSYGGTVTDVNIYYDSNQESTAQIGIFDGTEFTTIEKRNLPNNQEFYIRVPSAELLGKQKLNIYVKVESDVLAADTTLYIWAKAGNTSGQNLLYTDQNLKKEEKDTTDSYILELTGKVSVLKQSESGEVLPGVEFEIYDADNNKIGELTVGNNGSTQDITLQTNKIYQIREKKADIYGYKARSISENNISITNGTIIKVENGVANFKITADSVITIKNKKYLQNIEINKIDSENQKPIENVSFVIRTNTTIAGQEYGAFLALYDKNGKFQPNVNGTVTINENNIATDSNGIEYEVRYESLGVQNLKFEDLKLEELEDNHITVFTTNSDGKIAIKNLEVYSDLNATYNYTAYEISNENYGYGASNNIGKIASIGVLVKGDKSVTIKNNRYLGNLSIIKVDEENENIVLPNVGFVIENHTNTKGYAYFALFDENDKLVQNVTGTVTINEKNQANKDEYRVEYKYFGKEYQELTDAEKAQITTFTTDNAGKLIVNNLEKYSYLDGAEITYKLIEVNNPHSGYVADSTEFGNITIENGTTFEAVVKNKQKYIKLSGYVWLEKSTGKQNGYDCVYTEKDNNGNILDTKLTKLYIRDQDGKLRLNENYLVDGKTATVQIKLYNKATNQFIKEMPDDFDETGKYTFDDIEVDDLENYQVVFVYNGFYYATVIPHVEVDNGSKVKEVAKERELLNNKFTSIKDNQEVVGSEGEINHVDYAKEGHTSTVTGFGFDVDLTANTTETDYNLKTIYSTLKSDSDKTIQEIDNVNMGLVLREQPKISITDDILSVLVEFEGQLYNYDYNTRNKYYDNKNDDDLGVKFEQEYPLTRYTRTVYASDIQAAKEQNKEIQVYVTYKMRVANESSTLRVKAERLINYFDARYDVKAVGLGFDTETHQVTDALTFSDPQIVEKNTAFKSTIIDFNQTIRTKSDGDAKTNVDDLYITFSIQREAILDLLNEKSTYHNAVEVLSYSTYYGALTSYVNEELYTTDQREAGSIYAGIDRMSQPGNMELKLIDHPNGGTQILDNTFFEDDTDSAPSLLLEAKDERKILGTIWEDAVYDTSNNQKLGNGVFDQNEKIIQNVKVELYTVNEDGSIGDIAKYSNDEPVSTVTDEKGNYTLGYYDEANNKHVGILPGRYVIKYTYNNDSYIVGNKNIKVDDYKSTIIKSNVIKDAFENKNEKWFAIQENNRYSDARDDISLRPDYNPDNNDVTVKNSTYNNLLAAQNMEAYTPIMNIGLEFTAEDTANGMSDELGKELKNIDFGIIERPDIDITVDKKITGLEVLAQNGTSIVPKGNPSDANEKMEHVRTGLDGLVSAEIETELLQGAELKLEYTISLQNNSDMDYLEEEYYYYGTGGETPKIPKAITLVDYLDNTMSLDSNQAQDEIWTEQNVEYLWENGLISEEIYNKIKDAGNVHVLLTNAFKDVGIKQGNSVKLYTTRYLAVSDEISELNSIEVLELTGRRTIKETTPGNYDPSRTSTTISETDNDKVDFIITPPTGTSKDYTVYIIATAVTFVILVLGIVIIKKTITKRV